MSRLSIIGILLSVTSICCSTNHKSSKSKYFEGMLLLRHDFVDKTNKYDSVTLAVLAGKSSELYFKEGNFLTIIEGGITTRLLYRKDENKMYREKFTSDSAYWTNCNQPGEKYIKLLKTPKVEKILGIECDELKVVYENRTVSYFYNSDTLKVDPSWHADFTFYNENIYSREMKSLCLKTKIELKDFIIIETVTQIFSREIDDKQFNIPQKPLTEDK
jgi:hypothetical protein